ncbi:MAG: gliding motility-associated C-terminal domain-containing protein [Saprospiraceae bacterium]
MTNKKIQTLSKLLSLLLCCCLTTVLWAGDKESSANWFYVAESCSSCDFDVDVEVTDGFCGFNNGSIALEVSGGNGPYTYNWSTGETTSSISGLGDQHYFVTITDANGCSEELDIDVDDDSSNVNANIYPEDATCGLNNGSITSGMEEDSGIPPFVFTWDDGFVGPERTDLAPGTYCVTVTDAVGCTDDLCTTIELSSTAVGAVLNTTPTECDEETGTITVTPFGGNPPYDYEWSNGEDDQNLEDLAAGDYTLTITDDDDCIEVYTVTIEDDCGPPPCNTPVIASILIEEANCDEANGQVTITMANAAINYIYEWSNNISNNNTATNIPSGTYSVTITDPSDASCNVSETFTVGTVDGPTADLETTNADCGLANGTATFTPANYEYDWNVGADEAVRDDLAAGTYQVTITDPANPDCPDVITVVIDENQNLTYEVIINQEPDCEESNGSVTINVFGGSGDYEFSWGNGNTQDDLAAGIYCVDIVDTQNGCTATACFSLNNDVEQVSITIDNIDDIAVSCAGDENGTVVFTIDEMNAETPLTISIQDVDGNEYEADELPVGNYCIVVTDADDCAAGSACFEVTTPDHLDVDIAVMDVTCDDAGSVELLFIDGGTAPYTIAWSEPGFNNTITNLTPGDYSFTLTDANGCSLSETVTVEDEAVNCDDCTTPVIASVLVIETECGVAEGQATVTMADPTTAYIFEWTGTTSSNNVATNLASGTYTVVVTDPSDPTCTTSETFTVGTVDGPTVNLETTNADCGLANGTATFTPANYEYDWNEGDDVASRTDLAAGNYQVTIIDPANPNCPDVITVVIEENENLDYEVVINQLPDCNESNGSVTINVIGGSGDYTFSWGNSNTQTNLPSGIYCVDIEDNTNGCETTACFSLNDNVEQATVTIDATDVQTSCPGSADGTVVFTIEEMNAAQPLTITIEDADGNEYTNGMLSAGSYCILVADANDCSAGSACFEVTEPENLDVDVAVTDVTCDDAGSVELLFIDGGTAPYTIAWSEPGSNNAITNLTPGDYSFTLTDANGCSLSETVTVDDEAIDCDECITPIIASIVVIETPCGQSNGQATITMAVPGNYTYEWLPNISTTNVGTGLASGTYSVTITEADNLECPIEAVFTVGTIDGPEVTLETTNSVCGLANGTAAFSPDTYQYDWNVGDDLPVRTDLAAGSYQVTITDPADPSCPDVVTVVIGEDPGFTAEVVINQLPECNEANGSVTLNVTGGSGDYSFSWGNGNTQDNLPSGPYCVVITDNVTTCEVTACFSLNDNVPLSSIEIDPAPVQVSCPGSEDGTVIFTVDALGAVLPLDTTIVDADNNVYTNGMLPPGNYCIFITDANNCAAGSDCFEVTTPEQLDVDIAIYPFTCEEPGSIDLLFISGGTTPYDISWSTTAGGSSLSNLMPGDYSFTLTDANNCSLTETMTILDEAIDCDCEQPIITSVVVIETDCEETDGSATINILQNPANYSFEWSCGSCSNNQSITGVPAGTYVVTITDLIDSTCNVVETFTIGTTNGPEPTQIDITPATCNDADGAVTLTPATYTYIWSDLGTGPTRTDLAAGEYQVTVSDDSIDPNCIDVLTIIVGQNNPLELAVTIDVLPDCEMGNGQATIEVTSGGSGDYSYSWGDATQTGLGAGLYIVFVTDNITGCEQSISFVLNNNVPPANVVIENENLMTSCPGAGDATVVYTVTPDLNFNGPPIITIVNIDGFPVSEDNLGPGEYCIIVTDADGCFAGSACFNVTDPSQVDVDIAVIDESCTTLGSIELSNIVVGTAPYTIVWPTIIPAPSDPENITGLEQGIYNFVLTDANGCSVSENVTVENTADDLNIVFTPTPPGCEGEANGSITAMGENGTPDYSYEWSTMETTQTISDLGVGTYVLTLTDAVGCSIVDSVTLNAAPTPASPMLSDTVSCDEFIILSVNSPGNVISWFNCDGTVAGPNPLEVMVTDTACYYVEITNTFNCSITDTILVIEAPLPEAEFSFELSPCSDTAFLQFTDLSTSPDGGMITDWDWVFTNGTSDEQNPGVTILDAGDFIASLTVTNEFGCTDNFADTTQVNLFNNYAPPAEITICPGDSTNLFPGANPDFTYSWSPVDSLSDPTAPNPLSGVVSPTTYNVTVTSADGLCEVVRTVELGFFQMFALEIDGDSIICDGGSVLLSATTNASEICWYDENALGTNVPLDCGDQISVSGLDPSSPYYYGIATDANGCEVMDSVKVMDYSIAVAFEPQNDICVGDSLLLNPLYTLSGGVDHDYMWSPTGIDTEVILVTPEETTTYEVSVSNEFCETTESFEVTVRAESNDALLSATPDTICWGESTQLEAWPNGEEGFTYEWTPENTLNFEGNESYSPTANPLETTDYTVTITDDIGCESEATTRVTVIDLCEEPFVFFPNAFSPNDDGHNDILYLRGAFVTDAHFVIYNRWGEKIFESNDKNIGWDGTFKGEELSSDVYGFYLRARCGNGDEFVKKGNVTLLR